MLRSALKQPSRPSSPAPSSPPHPGLPLRTASSSSLATFPSTVLPSQSTHGPSMLSPNSQSPLSPPLASQGYTPKVSFDTFENPVASMFSFTLHVHSEGYVRNHSTRVFLCASSPDESGSEALEWALECLVQDGDELIVFRGIDQEELDKDHELVREEARELMRHIQEKCVEYDPDRKISIILEFIAGRVTTTLDRLIALYRPDSVVVGMRGERRGVLGFGGPGGVFSGTCGLCIKVRSLAQSSPDHCRPAGKKSKKGARKKAQGPKTRDPLRGSIVSRKDAKHWRTGGLPLYLPLYLKIMNSSGSICPRMRPREQCDMVVTRT